MKKFSLFILMMLLPMLASADAVEVKGICYNLSTEDNTAEVTYGQPTYSGEVIIPETVEYGGITYNVTSIGNRAFQHCYSLTSVIIPETITTIGTEAFIYCYTLRSLTIPKSVASIANRAFLECSGLTTIKVEDGNTVYDSRSDCNALIRTADNTLILGCKNTIIPDGVTKIDDNAFVYTGITDITLPASVTSVSEGSFYEKDVATITVAKDNAIYDSRNDCNAIIKTANNMLVRGCKNTVIPSDVKLIGPAAFYNCGEFQMTIPEGVTGIGPSAFGNSGLASVVISQSVTIMAEFPFVGCKNLTSVTVYWQTPMSIQKGKVFDKDPSGITLYVPAGTKALYEAAEVWKDFKQIIPIGDTNGDGKVTITDAVAVMDYIGGNPPAGFNPAAANVNGDFDKDGNPIINLTDVIAIMDIILSQ